MVVALCLWKKLVAWEVKSELKNLAAKDIKSLVKKAVKQPKENTAKSSIKKLVKKVAKPEQTILMFEAAN
jgi:hypothetical protein